MKNENIEKLEALINKQLKELRDGSYNYIMRGRHGEEKDDQDEDDETSLFEGLKLLYLRIICYLEMLNLKEYKDLFIKSIGTALNTRKNALNVSAPLYYYYNADPYLTILSKYENFLSPFQVFNFYYEDKSEKKILEEVLVNSAKIVSHTNTVIKNETSIYTQVKWFLEVIFPKTRSLSKARFIKKFTTYHPDILVPELKIAIEYKLIRKGKNIEDYINQVKTDADNYEGDSEYKEFYAVLFIMDKTLATEKAIISSWKEKQFPKDWHLIVVFK